MWCVAQNSLFLLLEAGARSLTESGRQRGSVKLKSLPLIFIMVTVMLV